MIRQPPANEDRQALVEYRRQVFDEMAVSAPMTPDQLDAWKMEAGSHISTWIEQDGLTVADVVAGQDPDCEASKLFSLSKAVTLAYHEKRQQVIDAEVTAYAQTLQYAGGQEAADRNAKARFEASLREDDFDGAMLVLVSGLMFRTCLARVIARLRAEDIAAGGALPDKPQD